MNSKNGKIIATIAVAFAAVGFVVYSSMASSKPDTEVDIVVSNPDNYAAKTIRIHGFVEAGSISEKIEDQKTRRIFTLERNGKRISVQHEGPKPDTFRDYAEVNATGKLVKTDAGYVFHAQELSAKCPSKYEGPPGAKDKGNIFD